MIYCRNFRLGNILKQRNRRKSFEIDYEACCNSFKLHKNDKNDESDNESKLFVYLIRILLYVFEEKPKLSMNRADRSSEQILVAAGGTPS